MSSKAQRRRNRQIRKQQLADVVRRGGPQGQSGPHTPTDGSRTAVRPTSERFKRGEWAEPQGALKNQQPIVDLASDEIGILYHRKRITNAQEQAARTFQEIRARYIAEFPDVTGFKSCLAGSVPGYDDGDGNPMVLAEYRAIEAKLSLPERRELIFVCDGDGPCRNIEALAAALDVVAGVRSRGLTRIKKVC